MEFYGMSQKKPQLTADDLSKSLHPFTWLFIQSTICFEKDLKSSEAFRKLTRKQKKWEEGEREIKLPDNSKQSMS